MKKSGKADASDPRDRSRPSAMSLKHKIVTRCKLHQLRILLEVARQANVSRAASALNIAQPAVTKTLHEVESIFGGPLFDRRPRGVVLNLSGKIVLPHVEALFSELNRIGDDLTAMLTGLSGTIAVGGTMTVLPYLLPRSLTALTKSSPNSIVTVTEGTIDQLVRALARGDVDLVLGRVLGGATRYDFTREILFEDPFVPVVGAFHPLAKRRASVKDLCDYPWILPPEGSSAREPLDRHLFRNRVRLPARMIETVSYQVTVGLLETSDVVAVLPRHLAKLGAAKGSLAVVGPAIKGGSLPVGLTYRSNQPLHPLALSMAENFRRTVAEMIA